jgi:polypeptide N-acetylgalactosaminyltransferase
LTLIKVGGFSWSGHFNWITIPDREKERQKRECKEEVTAICPTYTPTMAGGLLAVERQYFWDLGGYDELVCTPG